jgi:hypothetical protein
MVAKTDIRTGGFIALALIAVLAIATGFIGDAALPAPQSDAVSAEETRAEDGIDGGGKWDREFVYDDAGYQELGAVLRRYLLDYYRILETGNLLAFDVSALDAHSYLALKEKTFQSEIYKVYYEGIRGVELNRFTIIDVRRDGDDTDVDLYAAASYTFRSESSGQGTIFHIRTNGDRVIAFAPESAEITSYVNQYETEKAARGKENITKEDETDIIDELFAEKVTALLRDSQK